METTKNCFHCFYAIVWLKEKDMLSELMLIIFLFVDIPLLILLFAQIKLKKKTGICINILIMIWASSLAYCIDNGRSLTYFHCNNTIFTLKKRLERDRNYDVMKAIDCYMKTYEKTDDVEVSLAAFREELDRDIYQPTDIFLKSEPSNNKNEKK